MRDSHHRLGPAGSIKTLTHPAGTVGVLMHGNDIRTGWMRLDSRSGHPHVHETSHRVGDVDALLDSLSGVWVEGLHVDWKGYGHEMEFEWRDTEAETVRRSDRSVEIPWFLLVHRSDDVQLVQTNWGIDDEWWTTSRCGTSALELLDTEPSLTRHASGSTLSWLELVDEPTLLAYLDSTNEMPLGDELLGLGVKAR